MRVGEKRGYQSKKKNKISLNDILFCVLKKDRTAFIRFEPYNYRETSFKSDTRALYGQID